MDDDLIEEVRRQQGKRFKRLPPPMTGPLPDDIRKLIGSVVATLAPRYEQRSRNPTTGAAPAARLRVACMMMQKDEEFLLDPWLRYHAYLFGAENLFVLDNGSTQPDVLRRLERAETDGVTVIREFREKAHFEDKGRVFHWLVRRLERVLALDFLMPLDCDEFVAVMDPDGRVRCEPDTVKGYLGAEHLGDPRVLYTTGSFFNVPSRPGWYSFRNERKCFFADGVINNLGMGFHRGWSRLSDEECRTRIIHFHFRYRPYASYLRSAKLKMEARVDEFSAEEVAKSQRSGGSHMARLAFLSEEEYSEHFAGKKDLMPIDALQAAFARLGLEMPS